MVHKNKRGQRKTQTKKLKPPEENTTSPLHHYKTRLLNEKENLSTSFHPYFSAYHTAVNAMKMWESRKKKLSLEAKKGNLENNFPLIIYTKFTSMEAGLTSNRGYQNAAEFGRFTY